MSQDPHLYCYPLTTTYIIQLCPDYAWPLGGALCLAATGKPTFLLDKDFLVGPRMGRSAYTPVSSSQPRPCK